MFLQLKLNRLKYDRTMGEIYCYLTLVISLRDFDVTWNTPATNKLVIIILSILIKNMVMT